MHIYIIALVRSLYQGNVWAWDALQTNTCFVNETKKLRMLMSFEKQ